MQFGSIITESAARILRYGRDIQLGWERDAVTGPQIAGYEIAAVDVDVGYDMYIYGYAISAEEANSFYIRWESDGSTKYLFVDFASNGTVHYTDNVPINEGSPANRRHGSAITEVSIHAINAMGAGMRYSAALLVGMIRQEGA